MKVRTLKRQPIREAVQETKADPVYALMKCYRCKEEAECSIEVTINGCTRYKPVCRKHKE